MSCVCVCYTGGLYLHLLGKWFVFAWQMGCVFVAGVLCIAFAWLIGCVCLDCPHITGLVDWAKNIKLPYLTLCFLGRWVMFALGPYRFG